MPRVGGNKQNLLSLWLAGALLSLGGCYSRLETPAGGPTGFSAAAIGSTDNSVTSFTFTPNDGSSFSSITIDLGADFTSANICSAKTIFGRAGSAVCNSTFDDLTPSGVHRDRTTTQIRLTAERAGGTLPTGYREIPLIAVDDDGFVGGNVVYATRPAIACGTTQSTIDARVADCTAKNPVSSPWNGPTRGNAAQTVWSLVTFDGTYEVWRDELTQLLWSDALNGGAATNWCRAAGNAEAADTYCGDPTVQDQVTPESWCTEAAGHSTPPAYDSQKGGLLASTTPAVRWRLPTKYDWQQADNDGVRFVLPRMGNFFWCSTIFSNGRTGAWIFSGVNGFMDNDDRSNNNGVHCVGR